MRETRRFEPTLDEVPSREAKLKHFKGGEYVVLSFADCTRTGYTLIIYGDPNKPWKHPYARPLFEFYEEVKSDSGEWVRRFVVQPT